MDYLIVQLIAYLVLAFAIGLVVGWSSLSMSTGISRRRGGHRR